MSKIEDLKEQCNKGLNGGSNSVQQRQEQSRIYENLGRLLLAEGKTEEA